VSWWVGGLGAMGASVGWGGRKDVDVELARRRYLDGYAIRWWRLLR